MDDTPRRPCRICRRPTQGDLCDRCWWSFYLEAAHRRADTSHARTVAAHARDYEQARQADEADAPPKLKGPAER